VSAGIATDHGLRHYTFSRSGPSITDRVYRFKPNCVVAVVVAVVVGARFSRGCPDVWAKITNHLSSEEVCSFVVNSVLCERERERVGREREREGRFRQGSPIVCCTVHSLERGSLCFVV
jgi:hypothetical protein